MDWTSRAIDPRPFMAWDAAWRKKLGFFAGLRFFQRTSDRRSCTIASRHWPHKLCWDWSLSWTWAVGRYYYPEWRWRWSFSRRRIHIGLLIGHFDFQSQGYGYMRALGPDYADAPRIVWKREILQPDYGPRYREENHNG